ncbi:MAG: M20/M25/M40 family metallo-hydrolase [Spirochaeta sp.]|nr:M20/M25/M40 family metallo-hydrolase [Spirochaeta sp.]
MNVNASPNNERLRIMFVELCRIPSPSGNEQPVAEYIRTRLSAAGVPVSEDEAGGALGGSCGNLHLRLEPTGEAAAEPLFLAAHMDTVPPDPDPDPDSETGVVPLLLDGDRVHTAGRSVLGGDDKLGIAAALELILSISEDGQSLPRSLDVVFTVQEERGAKGASYFDASQLRAVQGYVLDGEGPVGSAITKAPTKYRYSIDVRGRRSHAAVDPDAGRNAVAAAGDIAARMPLGRPSQNSTANVGSISGGGPSNIVPDTAQLVGEIRSFDPAEIGCLQDQIQSVAEEVAVAREVSAKVTWEHLYDAYQIAADEACLRLFSEHCRNSGNEPRLMSSLGGGDANAFNNKGLRSIVYGLGMHNIHSRDEYALFSELEAATELLFHIVFGM